MKYCTLVIRQHNINVKGDCDGNGFCINLFCLVAFGIEGERARERKNETKTRGKKEEKKKRDGDRDVDKEKEKHQ